MLPLCQPREGCPSASGKAAYKSSHAQPQQPLLHSTRANPFPKVTGLICRLPLPAFFISNRGCSPWGPDAVMGTLRRRIFSRTVFQGPPVANWTPDKTRRSAKTHLFLPTSGFHSVCLDLSNRKEISAQCDPDNVTATACVTASTSVCRNINLLPFRRCLEITRRLRND